MFFAALRSLSARSIHGRLFYKRRPKQVPHLKQKATKWLEGRPMMKGVCVKVYTTAPKKPNSALRKVARVRLRNGRTVLTYIPGIGHNLQVHSVVMVRGGAKAIDVPGCFYKVIRGKYDCLPVKNRLSCRSKYGAKLPADKKNETKVLPRLTTDRDRRKYFYDTGKYLSPTELVPNLLKMRKHRTYSRV